MKYVRQHTQVKVNFYSDVGELTSRTLAKRLSTLANRPKTLANESLAKRPDTILTHGHPRTGGSLRTTCMPWDTSGHSPPCWLSKRTCHPMWSSENQKSQKSSRNVACWDWGVNLLSSATCWLSHPLVSSNRLSVPVKDRELSPPILPVPPFSFAGETVIPRLCKYDFNSGTFHFWTTFSAAPMEATYSPAWASKSCTRPRPSGNTNKDFWRYFPLNFAFFMALHE